MNRVCASGAASLFALAGGLMVFLLISLRQFHLPGFYYDEALDLVPMLDLMGTGATPLLRDIGLGRYPLMLLDYMGSLGGYVTVPFFKLMGVGWQAARAQPIFFSCITLVLAWRLARRWFGDGVAALTVLLLAVNPSFIWFSRQGISVTSVMTVFSLAATLLLAPKKSDRPLPLAPAYIFFAGLLLGLGLWAKFLFFRWLLVLVLWQFWLVITRSRASAPLILFTAFPRLLAALFVGFLIGCAPLLYWNAIGLFRDGTPWTLGLLMQSLLNPTQQFGISNFDFAKNLPKAIDDVRVFIDGSYFWYNGVPFSNQYSIPTLFVALCTGLVMALRRGEWRAWALLPLGMGALTLLGAFTVTGLWSTHQFIMLPLPQMLMAYAATRLAEELRAIHKTPLLQAMLALLLIAPLGYGELWVNAQHHATLARTGGSGRFSDAVYKLADHLRANNIIEPLALDWGIEKQVRVLTANQVRPMEIFGYVPQPDEAFRERVQEALKDPDASYIMLWDQFAVYNRRAEFTRLAQERGLKVIETFIAHERSGLPVYVVLQTRP